jgi:hypothetical protein
MFFVTDNYQHITSAWALTNHSRCNLGIPGMVSRLSNRKANHTIGLVYSLQLFAITDTFGDAPPSLKAITS